jgi:DNA-binding transcriptional MocR family regulator
MTIWTPDLGRFAGPRYRAIADALDEDIRTGALTPGTRMPTHRELAWQLKMTVGTITRAYAEAERRGLISGEVGRGTFVRAAETPIVRAPQARSDMIDFAVMLMLQDESPSMLARTLRDIGTSGDLDALVRYDSPAGRPEHRAAGAHWLKGIGIPATADEILVTCGGHSGISLTLAAFAEAGDVVASETMTYAGLKAICQQRRLRLEGIACDGEGILPDALAAACRTAPIRFLYLVPNLQNPLGGILSIARRRAIVEVCRRHDVLIVEDDILGFLIDRPPSFAELAPERTMHVASLSKCAAPGLRIGWLKAPADRIDRLTAAIYADFWMAPPLMAEIASRWVWDGTMAQLAASKRAYAPRRMEIARRLLGNRFSAHPNALHFWLPVAESWRAADFAAEARRRGVAVLSGEVFSIQRSAPLNGVRVCLGGVEGLEVVERGLDILARLLDDEPDASQPIV